MINFTVKPSLEHLAFVKVAAILWNQHDIRTLMVEFTTSPLFYQIDEEFFLPPIRLGKRRESWQKIEDKVIEKVSQLTIRTSLKDKILCYIQAVGFHILTWLEYHFNRCGFDLGLPNEFFWTSQGRIDTKKTAEVLINNESVHIMTRYKLACMYCLEHDIPKLWDKMPECHRESFYCEENPSMVSQPKLVVFWTYTIKGEVDKLNRVSGNRTCSLYRYAFRCAAFSCNKVATEYFFQKLRNKLLIIKTALYLAKKRRAFNHKHPPREYYTEVFCFLLSKMNSEQQIEVFTKNPFDVLRCFLDWPWQNIFVEMASHLWKFLPENLYHCVLRIVIHQMLFDYKDYNYEKMFEELWQQMPNIVKSYVINDSCIAGLVLMLLQIKDIRKVNIFKLIFQDATLMERNKLIFSERGRYICKDLIDYHQWDLVKFFVKLCITSKDEMVKFKQEFEEHMDMNVCDEFSQILNDFVREYDKRKSVDEGDSSLAKKHCILND